MVCLLHYSGPNPKGPYCQQYACMVCENAWTCRKACPQHVRTWAGVLLIQRQAPMQASGWMVLQQRQQLVSPFWGRRRWEGGEELGGGRGGASHKGVRLDGGFQRSLKAKILILEFNIGMEGCLLIQRIRHMAHSCVYLEVSTWV